jgi:hypothetical protein
VAKYEASGSLLWSHQFGFVRFSEGNGIAADALGNVFVAGFTEGVIVPPGAGADDAFVAKYDPSGNQVWIRQFGTSASDRVYDAAADGTGNVYLTGSTNGNLGGTSAGGRDALITKWDADGTQLWSRLLGTDNIEESLAIAADSFGNAYIGGQTWGNLAAANAGFFDAFLSKYDGDGNLQWTRQFGTTGADEIRGISLDGLGNVYVAGWTDGTLAAPHAGGRDALVAKFDSAGNLLWNYQFGTAVNDNASGVSVDIWGNTNRCP